MSNVNSFTETVNILVDQVNIAMNNVVSLNKSITTQEDTIPLTVEQIDPVTGDPSLVTYSLPSYNNVINKVNAVSQTVDIFVKGDGLVLLDDGTYRKISTIPVAVSPPEIKNITPPTKFTTRENWFFESMMFPQLIISFDLKGKIDDRSDRVVVKRVIFDNFNDEETQWFLDNVASEERTYYDTITYLNQQEKKYWEDEEIVDLPLFPEPYIGYFIITDKRTISSKEWFYLNTMNYGITTDSPIVKDRQLSIGDNLRYNNSIWRIVDINISEKRIKVVPIVGMDSLTINGTLEIYTAPFTSKTINIAIGHNECNVIFLKSVNDDFNIIADNWGIGVPFWTNSLITDGGILTLDQYYRNYVSDFGKQLEGQAKEKYIPAFFGVTPNVPILESDMFSVNRINTQLNAALDTEEIKNTQIEIESLQSQIIELRTAIARQNAELVTLTDQSERSNLNSKIATNINNLSLYTIQYRSLVRSLSTLAYESSAVNSSAKYRVRGFFPMPEPIDEQKIIQFEIAYRYLKLDNTGTALNTYSYADPSTGQIVRGTFSDWNIYAGLMLKKIYDEDSETYLWVEENISDGQESNINQVDIPITKGEKVELKIRSISEAGWPLNPLKSDWSESVIIEFPSDLERSDQVINILTDAASEEQAIRLDEMLAAAGVPTHLADSVPNPNTGDGTYFKHQAVNLAFDLKIKNTNGTISIVNTTDLQTQLENLPLYTYVTIARPTNSNITIDHMTGTIQQFFQAIVNIDPSIYDEFFYVMKDSL